MRSTQAGACAIGLVGIGCALMLPTSVLAQDRHPTLSPASQASAFRADIIAFSPPLGTAADYLPLVRAVEDSHLLLKLSERTLYLYNRNTLVGTYPVAIGRQGWETPTGRFTIFQMQEDPVWEHPFTGERVPPGDANPLGHRWLGFWSDGTNAIGFHGTPDETTIGQAISHGCVRLHNQHVVELYEQVTIGTPVYVIP